MFRKTILIPALLLGTALFMMASTASAHEYEHRRGYEHHPVYIHPHPIVHRVFVPPVALCHQYQVVYRPNCNAAWLTQGFYPNQAEANSVAAQMQALHFESLVWAK